MSEELFGLKIKPLTDQQLIPGTVIPHGSTSVHATVIGYQCAICGVQWFVGMSHHCPKMTAIQSGQLVLDVQSALERAIREDEREACAKIADEIEDSMAEAIAERIRARG